VKRSLIIRTAICGLLCMSAGSVFAGTYAVPSQYATIQAAINVASSNSVINVAPGVYNENLNFGNKTMITVNGTGGAAATTIDGGGTAPLITVGSYGGEMQGMPITLKGFTLQNGYSATTGGVATVVTRSELTITECIIKNNQAGSGGAFAVSGVGGILSLSNSLIANNTAINAGGAIYADINGKINLQYNTITANVAADGASITQLYGASLNGGSNIIYGNAKTDGTVGYPVFNDPARNMISYSIIEGGSNGPIYYSIIDVDPGFVDAAATNYQLSAGSPAIDKGMGGSTKDILGVVRPQGLSNDYGAYEYVVPGQLRVNGACGPANGGTFISTPTADLCSAGTPSEITGSTFFNWKCAGIDGGTTASCQAQLSTPSDITPPTATSIVTSGTTSPLLQQSM